jgi:integration host factor subunit beta
MGTITKKDLVERIATKTGVSRPQVKDVCQEFLDQIIIELRRGNRLEFRDFGVFEVKERSARTAQNPKTMQKVEVPAKRAVKFKVGRLMRESVEMPQRTGGAIAEVKPKGGAALNGTVAGTMSGAMTGTMTSGATPAALSGSLAGASVAAR